MDLSIIKVERQQGERIILYVENNCNTWPYILFDTTYDEEGRVTNLNRHSFIFPNLDVNTGDFIVIYTGNGKNNSFRNKRGTTTHALYWGLDVNIWNSSQDSALLVKVEEYKRVNV